MPLRFSKKKRLLLIFVLGIVLASTVISMFTMVAEEGHAEQAEKQDVLLPKIAAYYLTAQELDERITAFGSVMARNKVEIYGKIEERIEKISVDTGDRVFVGKVLAETENDNLEVHVDLAKEETQSRKAALKLALAKLKRAQDDVERNMENIEKIGIDLQQKQTEVRRFAQILSNQRALAEVEGISRERLREAEAQHVIAEMGYQSLRKQKTIMDIGFRESDARRFGLTLPQERNARMEILKKINTRMEQAEVMVTESEKRKAVLRAREAELMYNETFIRSPLHGVVLVRNIDVGQKITRDAPLFVLADIGKVYLELPVPESELIRLAEGQQVFFTVDAYGGERFSAKVERVYPTIDLKTRTITVRAVARNSRRGKSYRLLPGMFVRASIITRRKRDIYPLPMRSVVEIRDGRARVYTVSSGVAREGMVSEKWVPVRYVGENYVEIEPGSLPAGALVAMSGLDFLYTGIRVAVSNKISNLD